MCAEETDLVAFKKFLNNQKKYFHLLLFQNAYQHFSIHNNLLDTLDYKHQIEIILRRYVLNIRHSEFIY